MSLPPTRRNRSRMLTIPSPSTVCRVKTDTCILDLEAKDIVIARKFYCDQFGLAMHYGIAQRFLCDAEEAQIEVVRNIIERLRFYLHLNMMLLGKCPAKPYQRFGYAQMLQSRRSALDARHPARFSPPPLRGASILKTRTVRIRELVGGRGFQTVQLYGQQRELLSDAIMQLTANSSALFLLRLDEPAGQITGAIVVLIQFFLTFPQLCFYHVPLFKEDGNKHDGKSQDGKKQLQKMHVVSHQIRKWPLLPRDAEYHEERCERKPAGGPNGSQPKSGPDQEGKWRIDRDDCCIEPAKQHRIP